MSELATDLVVWNGVYVALLLAIGAVARRARRARTLSDYFLAGRSIGLVVLFLTLFATQYSGNTVSAFPGQTYRQGLSYIMTVTFMIGIVTGYTLFAPRLFALSRSHGFVTPTDYLAHRFGSPVLTYLSAAIFVFTLANFLTAQLIALGHAFAGVTGGQIPYAAAVAGGALVILVYELQGGMRAVAWTDVFQGTILIVGLVVITVLAVTEIGTPPVVLRMVSAAAPEKIANPSLETCFVWLSNFFLLFLGAPLYPQAVQRIFAARRLAELKRALVLMAVIPLVAVATVVYIGMAGIALFPGLAGTDADQITFRVLAHLVERNPLAYVPTLIVMLAVVAAIMSTADSVLLSLASVITKDVVARFKGLDAPAAERYLRPAPLVSIAVMAILTAIALKPIATLWGLLVIKFEILIQLSPAFVLGSLHQADDPGAFTVRDILPGVAAGFLVAAGLYATGHQSLHGFHAGTAGVVANYLVAAGCRWARRRRVLGS